MGMCWSSAGVGERGMGTTRCENMSITVPGVDGLIDKLGPRTTVSNQTQMIF